ncbi:hypothetical protein [Clostridium sardiniense]|uniref:hypothetical protein n=1 Tax=Clostridium sardiniense TaxID=29369 RepID=UPI001957CB52|nr:hypothetical protein [Clostridium sardiniense]MBM7835756.1 hypothetical protein [Clostridium sardiniense]
MKAENTYILNLEAAYIYKAQLENEVIGYNTNQKKIDKDGKETKEPLFTKDILYSATIPYSLETIRAYEKYPDEWRREDEKYYTDLFVNVNFTKHYKIKNEKYKEESDIPEEKHKYIKVLDVKKIRHRLYTEGFKINGIKYCMFKRGGSKARTASAIFVKEEMFKTLYNKCLLGLEFPVDDYCDLTSKNAYISLIMSGIIGTIDIKREEILIIDDVMGKKMKVKASVTERNEDNEIVVNEYEDYPVQNNMTDGQGLLDESVFENNKIIKGHSVALLRNDFTKCAAFNTKLQEYYKENNITQVYDIYRGWVDSKDIKLVITPSSCKFLKFTNKFESKKECYLHWWSHIDLMFGVVKTDHIGNYGYANRLSYQMINSLELNYDEVKQIAQEEINYIKMLKNNCLIDNKTIGQKLSKKQREEATKLKNDMTYFMHYIGNNGSELSSGEIISDLISVNSDYRFTKAFKEYKKNQIDNYIRDVRTGKVRISNSLYSILFSCPYTMLKQTTQKEMMTDSISHGWEVYCPRFDNNKELCMIRNPQINSGNIAHVTNIYHNEYKWFNLSDFVVVLNTYDVDVMNRLQGCDFDIDSALLSEQPIIVAKAKECMDKYHTPINAIKGKIDLKRDTLEELAELDNYLGQSTRTIGQIVNKSAICNAYMWHYIANSGDKELIQKLYDASSMLSSFSQIAIDMAKKSFMDNNGKRMSLLMEMQKINKWEVKGNNILYFNEEILKDENGKKTSIKKMIVPKFFGEIANNQFRILKHLDCGMDYLQDVMDNELGKTLPTKLIEMKSLLEPYSSLNGIKNTRHIEEVLQIIIKCNRTVNWCKTINCKERYGDKARHTISKNAKKKAIENIKKLKLTNKTIMMILRKAFGVVKEDTEKKFSDMTSLTLTLLYNVNSEYVLNCFKSNNILNDKTLVLDTDGSEIIWCDAYKIIKKSEKI